MVEFLGDGTDNRCFLNQWWAQKVIADGAYWREAVKNAKFKAEDEWGFCFPLCSFCGNDPDEHKPDCAWLLAQGE